VPNYLIVTTDTEMPDVFLTQVRLDEILPNVERWRYSHVHRVNIFEFTLATVKDPDYNIPAAGALNRVAEVFPRNRVQYHINSAVWELEKLLPEQRALELQKQMDYLQKKFAETQNATGS